MTGFVETTKEASKGGYQGIQKIRGLLTDMEKVEPENEMVTLDDGTTFKAKDQIKVTLDNAAILRMAEGEEEPEIKEGRHTIYVPYAEKGKIPHANSAYMRCWVASAEALGKRPSEFKGEYVTLEKKEVVLFKMPTKGEDGKPIIGEDGKKVMETITTEKYFCFVADEGGDSSSIVDYVRGKVVGMTPSAAVRELALDSRSKQFPEYKEAAKLNTLAEKLGLVMEDGKYALPASEE